MDNSVIDKHLVKSYVGRAIARFLKASRSRKSAGSILMLVLTEFQTKKNRKLSTILINFNIKDFVSFNFVFAIREVLQDRTIRQQTNGLSNVL